MRRLVLLILAVAMAAMLTLGVAATEYDDDYKRPIWPQAMESVQAGKHLVDAVGDAAVTSYVLAQKTARRSSFYGYCGLMVSHQLYNLGINKTLAVQDGNGQFDFYYHRETTSGGYYINAYPVEEFSLEEALNTVTDYGNKDVFNLLVGFESTNSGAGSLYGHVVLINGIVDGNLYFVESFNTRFGGQGCLLTCTIEEFARYYNSWASFEGLVHFGDGAFSNVCPTISTDLLVRARYQTVLRSQPAMLGKKDSQLIRDVSPGEQFRAIALCRDTRGDYYKVVTNEGFGFISVNAVSLLRAGDGEMVLTDLKLPDRILPGQKMSIAGTVTATHGRVASLEVSIFSRDGAPVRKESIEVDDREGQLAPLGDKLWTELLEPGEYLLEVYAYSIAPVAGNTWGQSRYQRVLLHSRYLVVGEGNVPQPPPAQPKEAAGPALPEGWHSHCGVDYYVREGRYVTGWQDIEGKTYYFSASGAMCRGWLTVDGRTRYLRQDGTPAVGQLEIDGEVWMFGATGIALGKAE